MELVMSFGFSPTEDLASCTRMGTKHADFTNFTEPPPVCIQFISTLWRRGSSVSVLTRLRAGRPGFDSRHGKRFSLRHRVQTGPGAHQDSYRLGNGGKAAVERSWLLTSIWSRD